MREPKLVSAAPRPGAAGINRASPPALRGTNASCVSESEIQSAVRDYLRLRGWFVFKIHQSAISYKGIADLYAIKNGRGVWIEVKTLNGKQSEYQRQFERDIADHGGNYIVVRDLDDVMKLEGGS